MSALSADEYSQLSRDEQGVEDQVQMERIRKEQESLPYAWGQKLDHVEMSFPVPPGTRARQVQVTLKRTYLSVLVHNNVVVEVCIQILTGRALYTDLSNWMVVHGRSVCAAT